MNIIESVNNGENVYDNLNSYGIETMSSNMLVHDIKFLISWNFNVNNCTWKWKQKKRFLICNILTQVLHEILKY